MQAAYTIVRSAILSYINTPWCRGRVIGARWARGPTGCKMPALWKRITFSVASVLCIASVTLLVVALASERWVTGRILCKTGVDLVNASNPELTQFTGDIYYGLFQGGKTYRCGLGSRRSKIYSKCRPMALWAFVCVCVCMYVHALHPSDDDNQII